MRPRLVLALILLPLMHLSAQRIDSLRTDEQVEAFVNEMHKSSGGDTISIIPHHVVSSLPDYPARLAAFGSIPYQKADFDGNGWTDLLFNGFEYFGVGHSQWKVLVILSFGNDSFQIKELTQRHFGVYAAKLVYRNGQACINMLSVREMEKISTRLDTLVYRCGDFIEWKPPTKHHIESIHFNITGNLVFEGMELTITGDRLSDGTLVARLDTATRNRINDLLKYIDFPRLKEHYEVDWTDAIGAALEITYDHGKKKVIYDRGMIGTYGLTALEDCLFQLRYTQQWTPVAP